MQDTTLKLDSKGGTVIMPAVTVIMQDGMGKIS
jgi:hypothetical protein